MGEDSLAPLCIILVKSGAHGGKLLFKYPFPSYSAGPAQPASPGGQATPQPRHNPYAVRISEDLLRNLHLISTAETLTQHALISVISVSVDIG